MLMVLEKAPTHALGGTPRARSLWLRVVNAAKLAKDRVLKATAARRVQRLNAC